MLYYTTMYHDSVLQNDCTTHGFSNSPGLREDYGQWEGHLRYLVVWWHASSRNFRGRTREDHILSACHCSAETWDCSLSLAQKVGISLVSHGQWPLSLHWILQVAPEAYVTWCSNFTALHFNRLVYRSSVTERWIAEPSLSPGAPSRRCDRCRLWPTNTWPRT